MFSLSACAATTRQGGYGRRVVPVNPKGGRHIRLRTGDLDRRASIRWHDLGRAARRNGRAAAQSMMGTLPAKTDWFATMERAGVPMFNDVEEMAEAAGLRVRYPALRDAAHKDLPFSVTIHDRTRR